MLISVIRCPLYKSRMPVRIHLNKNPPEIRHIGTVCNGQILQWDLMSKIKVYRVETLSKYELTKGSAPKRFTKFRYKD